MKLDLAKNTRRLFYLTLLATLAIRLLMAYYFPLLGDEAYFILWARHPDYGYYDHTPMVAWLLMGFLSISDHPLWLRLPTVLILTLIGWAIYRLLRDRYPVTAAYAGIFYLLIPVNIIGVFVLTDTPLLLWSFLSALAFYQAQREDGYAWYALAGLFLGLAFYSKYFAVLLGISYLLYLLLYVRRGRRPYIGLLLIVAACLPFVVLNLAWNYYHCWDNYLFNLINRTQGTQLSAITLFKYLAWLVYLVTPPVIYYAVKQFPHLHQHLRQNEFAVFIILFILPVLLFVFIAAWKSVGLHWLLSFLPLLVLGMVVILDEGQFRKCCWFILPYSLLQVAGLFILLALSPGIFRDNDSVYNDIVLSMAKREILAQLHPFLEDYHLATTSYSESALLAYARRRHVMVVGRASYHGRQDDMLTDFRKLQAGNMLIFSYSPSVEKYKRYFEKFEVRPLNIKGATFYYALGRGFNYTRYREEVLADIIDSFYKIPAWLPAGACYMHARYLQDSG